MHCHFGQHYAFPSWAALCVSILLPSWQHYVLPFWEALWASTLGACASILGAHALPWEVCFHFGSTILGALWAFCEYYALPLCASMLGVSILGALCASILLGPPFSMASILGALCASILGALCASILASILAALCASILGALCASILGSAMCFHFGSTMRFHVGSTVCFHFGSTILGALWASIL